MSQGRTDFSISAGAAGAPYAMPEKRQRQRDGADSEQWPPRGFDVKRTGGKRGRGAHRVTIEDFTDALFDEGPERCQHIVDDMVDRNGDPQSVVERLLAPAARLIGTQWCADELDFVKVTVATSRLQRLFRGMVTTYPPLPVPEPGRLALLMAAPGEQHTFGLSVIDDALRRASWETDYCGGEEPDRCLRLASANDYAVMGISISVGRLLPDMVSFISKLRARSRNRAVVLIAGGSLAMEHPRTVLEAGVDHVAVDASSAVMLAEAVAAKQRAGAIQSMVAEYR